MVNSGGNINVLNVTFDELPCDQIHFSADQKYIIAGSSCFQTGLDDLIPAVDVTLGIDFQQFPGYSMKKDGLFLWLVNIAFVGFPKPIVI